MGLVGPAIEEVGDLDSVSRVDPEGPMVQAVEDQAAEEADDPASVGRMDPEDQRDQGVPAAEGPGSEAKAVEAPGLVDQVDQVDQLDRVAEALEVAGPNERHPAKVCP